MSPVSLAKRTAPTSKGGMERNASDKSERAGKDGFRAANRTTAGSNLPAHAYNPVSGTFHALESGMSDMTATGAGPNGRYRSFDGEDDSVRGGSAPLENDALSANGSCSGESAEDQGHGGRMANGGLPAGDKREKVRAKNEKKHQRQKERRAQEIKDRCTLLLTERKLEALAQQLVAMGFSKEKATAALLKQEDVERAVSWLLEGGGEESPSQNPCEGVVKIDISEELARLAELEIRYGYSMGEIERAVVACEGSLERAAAWLRERHPEANSVPLEEVPPVSPGPSAGTAAPNRTAAQPVQSVPIAAPQLQRQGSGAGANAQEGRRDDRAGIGNVVTGTSPMTPLQWPRQQPVHAPSSMMNGTQVPAPAPAARRAVPQSSAGPWKEMEPAKPAAVAAIRGGNTPVAPVAQPRQQRPLGPPARYAPPGTVQSTRSLMHPNPSLLGGATSQGVLPQQFVQPPAPQQQQQQAAPLPTTPPLPRPTSGGGTSTPSSYGGSPSLSPSSWSTGVPNSFSPSSVLFNHPAESTWQSTAGAQVIGRPVAKSSLSGESQQQQQASQVQPPSTSMPSPSLGWGQPLPEVPLAPGGSTATLTSGLTVSGWGSTLTASSIDWSVSTAGREAADWRMPTALPGSSGIWGGGIGGLGTGFTSAVSLGNEGLGSSSDAAVESRTYDIWSGSFGLRNGERVPVAEPERSGQEWTSPFAGKDLYVAPRQSALPFSPLPN